MKTKPKKLPDRELFEKLNSLQIRYTIHALQRLKERNILQASISLMLRGKTSRRIHETSKDVFENGGWKYRIQGADIDDVKISAVVAIESNIIVVTVFS